MNNRTVSVSEKQAVQLSRKGIQVLGEIKEVKLKRGSEVCSMNEFRQKHIHTEYLPDGKKIRKVDRGFETIFELDKNSNPKGVFKGEAYRERTMVDGSGREVSRELWEKMRK